MGPFQCTYERLKVRQTTLITNYSVLNGSVNCIWRMKIVTYSWLSTSHELTYFKRKRKSYRPNSIWQPGFKGALPSGMVNYSRVWGEDNCLQRAGILYMYVRGGKRLTQALNRDLQGLLYLSWNFTKFPILFSDIAFLQLSSSSRGGWDGRAM
jgi:hypothetical protein